MSLDILRTLDLRAALFVAAVVLIARPLPVLIALAFSNVPWKERLLVAFTGPRGVVLVAVAGLFGERLVQIGIEDAARIAPLAFVLVAATVVLHGFTLTPLARALGLTAGRKPGVMILGGSRWSVAFATALQKMDLPVIISDPNHAHLRTAREAGIETWFGDILSEAAEHKLELAAFEKLVCATDNDAYNTLVATDLAPEFGREHVHQLKRVKQSSTRHALPATLGGRAIGGNETFFEANARLAQGWEFRVTQLTPEFTLKDWRETNPEAIITAALGPNGTLRLLGPDDEVRAKDAGQLVALVPTREARKEAPSGGGQAGA